MHSGFEFEIVLSETQVDVQQLWNLKFDLIFTGKSITSSLDYNWLVTHDQIEINFVDFKKEDIRNSYIKSLQKSMYLKENSEHLSLYHGLR